jgi:Tfp pilus assembly protein PilF
LPGRRGDLVQVEARLREAIADDPDDETPHVYLAQLLDIEGRQANAAAERATAGNLARFRVELPAQAQSLYWVDPVKGGLRRRK